MNALCLFEKYFYLMERSPLPGIVSRLLFFLLIGLLAAGLTDAGVTARISGTVTDATGAAVAATVTATNIAAGVAVTQQTNGQGFENHAFYCVPACPRTV